MQSTPSPVARIDLFQSEPDETNNERKIVNQPDPERVRSHFDERSATYSNLFDDTERSGAAHKFQCRRKIVAELADKHSGRFLDCACGTGEITLAALESGNFATAVINDISSEMLQRAESLIGRNDRVRTQCEFTNGSVFDIPQKIASGDFNLIACVGLIAHVGRLSELLTTLGNLLASDGRLMLQTSLLDHRGIRTIKQISERRHVKAKGYAISHYWHHEIEAACEDAGLKIISCDRYGFDVPFLDRLAPRLSYYLEAKFAQRATRKGSEAVYMLAMRSSGAAS